MKYLKIIYLKDINDYDIRNFKEFKELKLDKNNYYKLKDIALFDINTNNYEDYNNLCCVISKEDTDSLVLYKDKIVILEQVANDSSLYRKTRKNSYGKYIIKKINGDISIVDIVLCNNQLSSESVFEYIDVLDGTVYNSNDIIIAYPLKNLDEDDIVKSKFFDKNKSIIFELLENHDINVKKRKEKKRKVLRKIIKGV